MLLSIFGYKLQRNIYSDTDNKKIEKNVRRALKLKVIKTPQCKKNRQMKTEINSDQISLTVDSNHFEATRSFPLCEQLATTSKILL